jgi:putative IMPACT (imprinted ancient) family translation regulator
MLTALLHSKIGEICAVSARYFGGTKLGTGGLARAYAAGVKEALLSLPTVQKVLRDPWRIQVDYNHIEPLRRLCAENGVLVEAEEFGAAVLVSVLVPVQSRTNFELQLTDLTGGAAIIVRRPDDPTRA